MSELYFYSPAPRLTVTLDSGETIAGVRCTHKDREAYRVTLPDGATGGLRLSTPGFVWADSQRGLLVLPTDHNPECTFALDDIQGAAAIPPEPEPPPRDPNLDPLAVIQAVHAQGDFDLATKEGCGEFTEACAEALYEQHSEDWGHIKKTPEQNNYQGHAVDAIMLRWTCGATQAGGYDIIHNSVSPEASPCFNYAGPADDLWTPISQFP